MTDTKLAYAYVPIVKVETDPEDDGVRLVYGKATGPDLDTDYQIIDQDFAKSAMASWFADWGNIRQMHSTSLPPAGKAVELESKDDGEYLKARIVEPGAVKLIDEGVYQAFSIGIANPRIIRDAQAKNGRITGGTVVENSIVDYPANPTTKFVVCKRRGGAPDGETVLVEEAVALPDGDAALDEAIEKALEPDATKAGAHDPIDGSHSHAHAAYGAQGGDSTHSHSHSHADDSNHNHTHDATKAADVPFALKRWHDALCPAYPWEAVKTAYPQLEKDGAAVTIGPEALRMVYQLLLAEVIEDNGEGTEIWDIYEIWCVYRDLYWYVQDEMYDEAFDNVFMTSRDALHAAFRAANTEVPELGKVIDPASFRRPYIAAGHQAGGASKAPRVPDPTHVAEGSDFARGALTDGHQRPSASKLLAIHDHLVTAHPGVCVMDAPPAEKSRADMTQPIPTPQTLPENAATQPTPSADEHTAAAPGEKAAQAEGTVPATEPDAIAEAVKAAVAEQLQPLTEKLAAQEEMINKLGGQPDPAQAPMRGPGAVRVDDARPVDRSPSIDEARERAEKEQRAQLVKVLRRQAQSSDIAMREAAEEQLAELTNEPAAAE